MISAASAINYFFPSTINGAVSRIYCSVEISTGVVTSQDGVHQCVLSDGGDYIIDNFANLEVPRQLNIC